MLAIGSLFSGIGGLDLGLERAGLGKVKWQVENNEFCRSVLAKHWPGVKQYGDIRQVRGSELECVDLICGGFPCQPFSNASHGRRVAEDLWPEMFRVICETRPSIVIGENVSWKPMEAAANQIATEGFSSTIVEVPAALVGAPHERSRWFLVGYTNSYCKPNGRINDEACFMQGVSHMAWQDPPSPESLGVDDGVPPTLDRARLKALGNAVSPIVGEFVGRLVKELLNL